ncbi:MAG: septal ring lytic transglycosylase RlpA family protein [Bryobacteraceae bacterium]|nr:septal ring lytic transglycosylase RlpA family protein [Bryobacteraceae bacterium]
MRRFVFVVRTPSPVFRRSAALALVLLLLPSGCGRKRAPRMPAAPQPGWTETGLASWYGHPYHGRPSSSGEIYDMEQLTAAHRTLPFGAIVEVKNLDNGRMVTVRINDRGPFVEGRIIDLSRAAARKIGLIGPGTALVRLRLLGYADAEAARAPALFTIQAGAFAERGNAERLQQRLRRQYEPVDISASVSSPVLYRIYVGRFGSLREAEEAAARLRREVKDVFVVRIK